MTKLDTKPYKGTRDWYPEDFAVREYIFETWRMHAKKFGYQEYATPLLEPLEVYQAKSGDELANKQTYAFTDRGDRQVAIRPEMTPSVSRLVAARRQELAYPARLFNVANFMRYERPQKGREREFWQLNLDMFGATGTPGEAEIIQWVDACMQAFGAKHDMYEIRINNRELIEYVMTQYLALDEARASKMMKLLDKRAKISEEEFVRACTDLDVDQDKLHACIRADGLDDLPEDIMHAPAWAAVRELFDMLGKLGIVTAKFDITLMRGLDYYTGTVFEVFDTSPDNNRSIFGGGRYDGLVELFGAEPVPAVGLGIGLTTMEIFLRQHNLLPEREIACMHAIIPMNGLHAEALKLNAQLTASSEVLLEQKSVGKLLKSADKKQAKYAIFVGEEEVRADRYTVKNLQTGVEQALSVDEINVLQ